MRTGRSLTVCRSLLRGSMSAWGGVYSRGAALGGCVCLGGCLLLGGLLLGGVCSEGCLLLGGCLLPGGVCSWGVSAPGGCLLWGLCLLQGRVCFQRVSAPGGWHPSMHWGRHPPVNRMTNRCKNITLATTSLSIFFCFKFWGNWSICGATTTQILDLQWCLPHPPPPPHEHCYSQSPKHYMVQWMSIHDLHKC